MKMFLAAICVLLAAGSAISLIYILLKPVKLVAIPEPSWLEIIEIRRPWRYIPPCTYCGEYGFEEYVLGNKTNPMAMATPDGHAMSSSILTNSLAKPCIAFQCTTCKRFFKEEKADGRKNKRAA